MTQSTVPARSGSTSAILIGAGVGGVLNIVATVALMMPIIFYALVGITGELTDEEIQAASDEAMRYFMPALIIIGGLCSIAGGYVAASLSKTRPVLTGIASSWLCILLGVYEVTFGPGELSLWLELALLPLTVLLAAFGGRL